MKPFGRWFAECGEKAEPVAVLELPEGVFEKDGKYFGTCRRCEVTFYIDADLSEINYDNLYCGRSQYCMP